MRKKLATVTAHRELTVNSRRAHGDQNGYSQPWLPWPGPWLSCDLAMTEPWSPWLSCDLAGVTELWPSCDWAVTELWPSLAVTSHRGHRELTVTIFFSWELSDIVLKFGRYLGSSAADVPVKFRSDMHILTPDPVTLRLYETSRKDVFSDIKAGPRHMSH